MCLLAALFAASKRYSGEQQAGIVVTATRRCGIVESDDFAALALQVLAAMRTLCNPSYSRREGGAGRA